ncbi:MAG: M23 family metallopeptidase [Bacteroidales bacterium]|jgi:murein DD-endopeptidase MepM/ murein hydrolase activator NlpD|nr:M23 family metallopeptidase [Bacteroidales bacterium]
MNLQNIKLFWKQLRKNWLHHYRIVIRNEKNLSDVFSLKLTPRRIFVLGTTTFFVIIILTTILIAFTPLRVYVPGYTNPLEYKLYKQMLIRIDSVERINAMNNVYLKNFYNVLSDIMITQEMNAHAEGAIESRVKDKNKAELANKQVQNAAELLWTEITERSSKNYIPLTQHVSSPTFTFTMPALGKVNKLFSIETAHLGIDIENEKGTLITSIADGVVISVDNPEKEVAVLIIQHSGNIVSIYKNVDKIFKVPGAKVKAGDPIATMGNNGTESLRPYLHFEIWFNGAPINPLEYFMGN